MDTLQRWRPNIVHEAPERDPERTGLTVVNERLRRKLKEAWRERSAARAEALTAQASLRRVERELEEARNHARRLCVALRAIRDEAAISGPPLESRREDWEAALREVDEVLGELEALYGELDQDEAAARRGEAQGEEDVTEFCHLCGEDFDPNELGTVIGPLGQDDGVPRWYRCPRCARAYDAGYQQGQRDPRGDGSYSAA